MAEKKAPRHERMYKAKPHLERGEDGHIGVKEKEADKVQSGTDDMKMEEHHGMPMHVKHSMERHHMNARHETEHTMHDHHGAGSKKEMHERHEKERKDMHTRHEKEMEAGEHKEMNIDGKNKNKAAEYGE